MTSSGTTTDFEAYDFDVFTDQLVIAGYVTGSESISIAEVSANIQMLYPKIINPSYCTLFSSFLLLLPWGIPLDVL